MLRIIFCILLLCIPAIVNAQVQTVKSDFAKCVQGQLNALGFNVGKIDGLPGRATQKAYNQLRAKEEFKNLPQAFNTQSLVFSCRYIGDKQTELKKFWPAWKRSFSLVTGQKVAPEVVDYIVQSMPTVHRRFAAFNMQHASTVNLHVFRDKIAGKDFYTENAQLENESAIEEFDRLYAAHCSNESIGGWSDNNNIYICLNYKQEEDISNPELAAVLTPEFSEHRFRFQEVMTGEMFHVSQKELLNLFVLDAKVQTSEEDEAHPTEPIWLYEGAAQYFELRFGGADQSEDAYYASLKTSLSDQLSNLSTFEKDDGENVAELGNLAVYKLQQKSGLKQFHAFYRAVGLGTPWREAFKQAFDISVETYYEEYVGQ